MVGRSLSVALLGMLFLQLGATGLKADDAETYFESHVRPILVNSCLECHGAKHYEGGLQLTSRELLLKGGDSGPVVTLPFPDQSRLMEAVRQQGDLRMPPDSRLNDQQLATLATWIEMGAPWPESSAVPASDGELIVTEADREHWSFRPIRNPPLPQVEDREWPQSRIDHFVLEQLESVSLRPSQAADRRTLLRRVYFGLVGLPPTWEEVREFSEDPRPTELAFQEVVDRLLASPRYGERWGRHWLDVARYADTKDGVLMFGYDRMYPFAYTYRDYVIRALNEDLPYHRFIQEQLAADLLRPKVEPWRLAALGFLTLGRLYDNNLHDVIDDRIDTVTRGFLGLTVACARCHDHKYDPIPTADYYALYGIFASCESPIELPPIEPLDRSPSRSEFEQSVAKKREELRSFVDEQFELLTTTARQRIDDYLAHVATTDPDPLETAIFFLSLAPDDLRPPIVARWRRSIRTMAFPDHPVFGLWHDLLSMYGESSVAAASHTDAWNAARGTEILDAWSRKPNGTGSGEVNPYVWRAFADARLESREDVARVYGRLLRELAEEAERVASSDDATQVPADPAREQLLALVIGPSSPNWFPKSETRAYMSRTEKDAFSGKVRELDRLAAESPDATPRAMVLLDAEIFHEPRIFIRGNPSQPGRSVPRQAPAIISSREQTPFRGESGRLQLAHALIDPGNPLTARVIVNRVWMHHFGEPLVSTPSDFGRRSSIPSHPALLDHLATQFEREGWSLKKLHRSILLSATYQQASRVDNASSAAGAEKDPENRWLWRMNRRRLEFEAMRDALLAVAGRLSDEARGRPVDLVGDPEQRRRTVYGLVDRQSLPSMFRAFDFASPDQTVERRPRTVVPQQALFAMNSPFVARQATAVAQRVTSIPSEALNADGMKASRDGKPAAACEDSSHDELAVESGATTPEGNQQEARIVQLYRLVLAREPDAEERALARQFLSVPPDDNSQLDPWEQLAHVLLLSNEFMYLD